MDERPPDEQPLHRLKRHGPQTLSDAELVSVLLGTNTLTRARSILRDGLYQTAQQLTVRDRSHRDAAKLAAAVEIGRRIHAYIPTPGEPVRTPHDLGPGLITRYGHRTQEHFVAVFLNSKNVVIDERVLFIGTLNSASISNREPVQMALELRAVGIIVCHNHPSGDCDPSTEDLVATRRLREAARLFGMDVLDHIIVGGNQYVSMRERGFLPTDPDESQYRYLG